MAVSVCLSRWADTALFTNVDLEGVARIEADCESASLEEHAPIYVWA